MKFSELHYFAEYERQTNKNIDNLIINYPRDKNEFDLGYRTQASAVFSSNIEGNTIDLNSYMNIKLNKGNVFKKKEISEIDDLIEAYKYAQANPLTEENFLHTHLLLSRHILIKSKQGKYRIEPIGVFSESGLVYLAIEEKFVVENMKLFFEEIRKIISMQLSNQQILYFASLIHLRFVHIHPFTDGNGRAARLLEKWFITTKLGADFWLLLSEKYYKEHQQEYYEHINLGVNFYELDYSKCLPFLLMLPKSFEA